jgi:hypothetical protein
MLHYYSICVELFKGFTSAHHLDAPRHFFEHFLDNLLAMTGEKEFREMLGPALEKVLALSDAHVRPFAQCLAAFFLSTVSGEAPDDRQTERFLALQSTVLAHL